MELREEESDRVEQIKRERMRKEGKVERGDEESCERQGLGWRF